MPSPHPRQPTLLPSPCPLAPPTRPPAGTPPSPGAAPPTPPSSCPWLPAAIASAAGRCPCAACHSRIRQPRPSTISSSTPHCSTCITHPRLPDSHPTASMPLAAARHGRGSFHTHQHRSALNTRCWISLLSKEVSCSLTHTHSLPLPLSSCLQLYLDLVRESITSSPGAETNEAIL